jgi:lyso-ornithine lipid O-acyltransferase
LARFLRSVVRSSKVLVLFVLGSLELVIKRPRTRQERAEWLHRFCARVIHSLGINVQLEGTYPERGMLISNHLGYLDIMVFAALHRCVFVSKMEMLEMPVLGWMTTMAGTVYVERGRGGSAVRAREGMLAAADAGIPVMFFPEGTTSNGSSVAKFHTGLLSLALDAGQPVTAAYIEFKLTEDNGPNVTVADDVCFWGHDIAMPVHVFRLLGLRGLEVHVKIADAPIDFSSDTLHRKDAAVEARAVVMELGGVPETTAVVQ